MVKSGVKLGNTLSIGSCSYRGANFRWDIDSRIGCKESCDGAVALEAGGERRVLRATGSGETGDRVVVTGRVAAVAGRGKDAPRDGWGQAPSVFAAVFFTGVSMSDRQAGENGAAGGDVFENGIGEGGSSGGNWNEDRGVESRVLGSGAGRIGGRIQIGGRLTGVVVRQRSTGSQRV